LFVPSALAVDPNPSYQDKGDFYLTYKPTYFQEYEDWLKEVKYFEGEIPFLNETFKLPYDVEIVIADSSYDPDCEYPNAFYYSVEKEIVICYEYISDTNWKFADYFDSEYGDNWTTEQLNYSTINVIDHTFYHEMGHALIDIYELPITGPEESVADQFGAFMVLGFLEQEIAHDIMMDTAIDFWLAAEENPDLTESAFADTHGLNQQRFYDLACWAYGSDPDYHQYMWSTKDWIPENRLQWCEWEYETMMYAWNILLAPFFKDSSPEFLYNYEDWFYQYVQTQQSQTQLESSPESSAQQGMVVQESMPKVPDWVRNIFIWYGEEKISEDELLNAIKFLVSQGIIKVSP